MDILTVFTFMGLAISIFVAISFLTWVMSVLSEDDGDFRWFITSFFYACTVAGFILFK